MNKTNMLYLFCNLFVDRKKHRRREETTLTELMTVSIWRWRPVLAAAFTMTLMSMLICLKGGLLSKKS